MTLQQEDDCRLEEYIDANPCKQVRFLKLDNNIVHYLSDQEKSCLLKAAKGIDGKFYLKELMEKFATIKLIINIAIFKTYALPLNSKNMATEPNTKLCIDSYKNLLSFVKQSNRLLHFLGLYFGVESTYYVGAERGIDVVKKVNVHKDHIIVDIVGILVRVSVHTPNKSNTIAVYDVLE